MLMRTDPFRELDRVTQQTPRRRGTVGRWDGADFTTPTGEPRPVTYLGRDALDIDLAPPAHKATAPLTITVDRQAGLILQQARADSGTHARWVSLYLSAHLPDELFSLTETDTPAEHDY